MEIKNTGFLNPYEGLKQKYSSNDIVKKYADDWNIFANQGKLDEYLGTLDLYEQKGGTLSGLETTYKPDFLSSQERLTAIANEAIADREKLVTKTRDVFDEETQEWKQEAYETTDYEYTKSLLQNIADEREKTYVKQIRNEIVTAEDVMKTIGSFFHGTIEGIVTEAADVYNLFEGVVRGFDYWAKSGDIKQFDKGYREAFTNDKWVDAMSDKFREVITDPETGDYVTKGARYLSSAGDSFGRMVPSMLLQFAGVKGANALSDTAKASKAAQIAAKGFNIMAKSGQVYYYAGMASSNLKESLNNKDLCTRPTFELMANAAIKTTFEWGVEKLLAAGFGSTAIDSMAFGYVKAAGKISGKTAVFRILKDALQEGTEEYLQDFSSYLVDRVFGLWAEDYKAASEWNGQVATDAFVMGALMSLAGSAFKVMTTKRVDTSEDAAYRKTTKKHEAGEVKYNKKGEVKTRKLSKLASFEYYTSIDALVADIDKYVNKENLSTEERTEVLAGVYTTLRTITNVFGEMGEERYTKAAQMLATISDAEAKRTKYRNYLELQQQELKYRKSGDIKKAPYEYSADGKTSVDSVLSEYKSTQPYTMSDRFAYAGRNNYQVNEFVAHSYLMSDAELKKAASDFVKTVSEMHKTKLTPKTVKALDDKKEAIAQAKITNVADVINKSNVASDKLSKQDLDVAKQIFDTSDIKNVIVTEDGVSAMMVDNDTAIVPINILESNNANGIFKGLAESKTVEVCSTYQPLKLLVDDITDIYRTVYSDKSASPETAVREFLYNSYFASTILYKDGNKDMLLFISTMDSIIKNLTENNAFDAIQKKEILDRRNGLKELLKQYIITQQNAEYRQLAIFTAEEKADIANKRYGKDFFNRCNTPNYKPNADDIRLFAERVNALAILSADDKQQLINDFKSGNGPEPKNSVHSTFDAIVKVNNYYDGVWTTKYDGKTYMPCDNLANTTFNAWLNSQGITIKDLTRVQGLDPDIYSTIEAEYGQVNRRTLISYYQESFKMFTKKSVDSKAAFTFAYDFNASESKRVTVKEASTQTELYTKSELAQYNVSQNYRVSKGEPYYVYRVSENVPKLDIFDSKYNVITENFTIDDAIRDVSILSKDVENDIKSEYGALTSHNAYLYLNNKLLTETNHKFGIVLGTDGKFVIVNLEPFQNAIKPYLDETINTIVNNKLSGTSGYTLKELVDSKYLNKFTKDTKVRFVENAKTGKAGEYDSANNIITVYLDPSKVANADSYKNALKIAFMHEFLHALQAGNNLTRGFTNSFFTEYKVSDKTKAAIIKDVKKHMPQAFKYSDAKTDAKAEQIVNDIIYLGAAGEAGSFGYAFDETINFAPWNIVRNNNGTLKKIVTPWGSEYTVDGVLTKSDASSMKVDDIDTDTTAEPTKTKKPYIRERITKGEAKGNNLLYIYNKLKKEGRQVIFIDERIKNLVKGLTPYMDKIDPWLANKIREGDFRTKSDVIDYIVNQLPETLDAKANATLTYINRMYYNNDNIKSGKELDATVTYLPSFYAIAKVLSSDKIRNDEAFNTILANTEYGDIDSILYNKQSPEQMAKLIKTLTQIPTIANLYNNEYIKATSIDIDRGLAMNSILNRFDGSLQSLVYVYAIMKTYADPRMEAWIKKPGKGTDKKVSLETDIQGKRQGTDKTTTLADTVADTRSDIYTELGNEFLQSSLNTTRDEKVVKIWEEMKNRYLATLTKDSDYSKALLNLSENGPLYQKLEGMTDTEIDKLYVKYGFQEDLNVSENIAEKLYKLAKAVSPAKARHQYASNIYRYANQIRRRLTGKQFQAFLENANKIAQEQGLELGFKKDGSFKIPREQGVNKTTGADITVAMPVDKVIKLEALLKDLYSNIDQYTVKGTDEFKTELAKAVKRVERDYKKELRKYKKGSEKVKYVEIGDMTIKTANNTTVPKTFQQLLDAPVDKYAESFVQNLSDDNSTHAVSNMQTFQKNNADTLASMDTNDAREIIDFIKNSAAIGEDAGKFTTTAMQTLTYIYAANKEGTQFLDMTADELSWIESYMESTVSTGGKILSSWRQLIDTYNPAKYAIDNISKMTAIDIDEEYVEALVQAGKDFNRPITGKERGDNGELLTAEQVREIRFRKLNNAFNDAYQSAVRNFKGTKRGLFEQLWKWQRMAMLSSPGTWVRNIVSNTMLDVANKTTPVIGDLIWKGLNKADEKFGKKQIGSKPERLLTDEQRADVHYAENAYNYKPNTESFVALTKNYNEVMEKIEYSLDLQKAYQAKQSKKFDPDKLAKLENVKLSVSEDFAYRKALAEYKGEAAEKGISIRRTMFGQYKIVGTKISNDAKNFIVTELFTQYEITTDKNGKPVKMSLYDMIGDALNKFSDNRLNMNESSVDKHLVSLITKKIQSELFMNYSFNTKALNTLSKVLYKCLSDDVWVKKTFVSYLGKILTEDDTNLTRGLTTDIMEKISDAYTMAAWDYMHKANFFSKMENQLRERVGEAGFFVYKQFAPFAVAGWNWFVEGLNYTPLGLAKAIIDYAKLDKKVEKMDLRHLQGEGPSGRFASYIVKRNIGKGVIGTIGFAIGAMLAGFGVAGIDEDDGQIKLHIGDVYIDISNIFGTQGILLGMVMANAFADNSSDGGDKFVDIFASTLDSLFMDSTFMDIYNIFRYSDTFGEGVLNNANNILMTFYPNIFKYFNRMTYQHKVKYSSGFLGTLERDLIQMLPGIAYAFPKRTDVYTGDVQYKYLPGFWGYAIELSNGLLPMKFKPAKVSDLEKEAITQGVRKAELRGSYSDIGKFNTEQTAELNEFYGKLNNKDLQELYSNKTTYKVLDKKTNKYVELKYSQMSTEQKKSVINRITSDNAQSAKIYVYTKSGGKYYTTNKEELAKLKKLGINNVYQSTKKESYFN